MIDKITQAPEELIVYHFNTDPSQSEWDLEMINKYMEQVPLIKNCASVAIMGDMEVYRI